MVDIVIVIPSLDGQVDALLKSIHTQTLAPIAIEVAIGINPNGLARNLGVERLQDTGEILVFIDDDAILGDEHALRNLVVPLVQDESIGITGAAKLIPPDAPWFQRWVAREVPRIEHAVVSEAVETNPDPPHYYCDITTTCCAMRRSVFAESGGFNEQLVRGVDTEFFVRVRRLGYRLMLVPHTWTWHPAPATLKALQRKHFLYGVGHAQEVKRDPSRARGLSKWPWLYILFRTLILIPNIFVPFSYAGKEIGLGFKPLKALTSYISAIGYTWEWYRGKRSATS